MTRYGYPQLTSTTNPLGNAADYVGEVTIANPIIQLIDIISLTNNEILERSRSLPF